MGNCLPCLGNPAGHEPLYYTEDEDDDALERGQNQPLLHEDVIWESEIPLTDGQLRGKRDTFWETAPIYEGRKEIWDALKVAIEAAAEKDYDLAQAILTGANISLPRGRLTEAYDELGNRYIIPKYCLSKPVNMQDKIHSDIQPSQDVAGDPVTLKIRLTNRPKDIKLIASSTDTILKVKQRLEEAYHVDHQKVTMLYSGRVLENKTIVGQLNISKGFVIQAIVNP